MKAAHKTESDAAPSLQISMKRSAILPALLKAKAATQRRVTTPILANVLLSAADGIVTVTGTDLETRVSATFCADMAVQGATTLPGAVLEKILKSLPSEADVTIVQRGDMVAVQSGDFSSSLVCLPAADFPTITTGEFSHSFILPGADLKKLIAKTSFAVSTEETRYYLNGIYLHTTAAGVSVCATDGHRLALCSVGAPEGSSGMPGCIIPRAAVKILSGAFDAGDLNVQVSSSRIRFTGGGVSVLAKAIDGSFPEYQRVIPKGNDKSVIVEKASLSRAIEQVVSVNGERSAPAKLGLNPGRLNLACVSHEYGASNVSLVVWYDGQQLEIGFQVRYLRDVLKVIGDRVRMVFLDQSAPAIFADPDDDSCTYVLMPMRV